MNNDIYLIPDEHDSECIAAMKSLLRKDKAFSNSEVGKLCTAIIYEREEEQHAHKVLIENAEETMDAFNNEQPLRMHFDLLQPSIEDSKKIFKPKNQGELFEVVSEICTPMFASARQVG